MTFKPLDALVSLLGIFGSGFIGYLAARHANDRLVRATALAKFRAAFGSTLAVLRLFETDKGGHYTYEDVSNCIKKELPRHAAAVEIFRPFISKHADKYEATWKDYQNQIEKSLISRDRDVQEEQREAANLVKLVRSMPLGDKDPTRSFSAEIRDRIENILSIANEG